MPRVSKCELVRKRKMKRMAPHYEWKGNPDCWGYIDCMTEEPLDECRKCEWFNIGRRPDDGRE